MSAKPTRQPDDLPSMDWSTGLLAGSAVRQRVKTLGELGGLFLDTQAWRRMDPKAVVYCVRWWAPTSEGTEGGLCWGTTTIMPGRVRDEYFMTHGHCHQLRNRGEIYSTIKGEGALLLAKIGGQVDMQMMMPGSTHYIRGEVAHRVANVGNSPLVFVACWPSDAGHDYGTIGGQGFGVRLLYRKGTPTLVQDTPNAG